MHQLLIPQSDLLVFPEDWFRRSLRTADSLVETDDEPWRQAINNQMQQEITFDFVENSLEEVIEFLRRTTNVNFLIDRSVFADDAVPPITLSGTMELGVILDWIRQLTGLNVGMRNEAVYVSAELGTGDTSIRIYNVSDLISPVQEFPAPELAYNTAGGGGDGFDLFGGVVVVTSKKA